jgi:hypothetical protein
MLPYIAYMDPMGHIIEASKIVSHVPCSYKRLHAFPVVLVALHHVLIRILTMYYCIYLPKMISNEFETTQQDVNSRFEVFHHPLQPWDPPFPTLHKPRPSQVKRKVQSHLAVIKPGFLPFPNLRRC